MSSPNLGLDLSPLKLPDYLSSHSNDPHRALASLIARHNRLLHDCAVLRQDKEAAERASERAAMENHQLWRSLKALGSTTSPRPNGPLRQNSEGTGAQGNGGLMPRDAVTNGSARGLGIAQPGYGSSYSSSSRKVSGGSSNEISSMGGHSDLAPPLPSFPSSPRFEQGSIDPRFGSAYAASSSSLRSKAATPPPTSSPRMNQDSTMSTNSPSSNQRKASSLDLGRSPNAPPLSPPTDPQVESLKSSTGSDSGGQQPQSHGQPNGFPRTPPGGNPNGGSRSNSRESSPRLPSSASMPTMAMNERGRFLPTITPVSPLMNEISNPRPSSQERGERDTSTSEILQHQLQLPSSSSNDSRYANGGTPRERTFSNQSTASSSLASAFDDRTGGGGRGEGFYPIRSASINNLMSLPTTSSSYSLSTLSGDTSPNPSRSRTTTGGTSTGSNGGRANEGIPPVGPTARRPSPHHLAQDSDVSVSSSASVGGGATRRGAGPLSPVPTSYNHSNSTPPLASPATSSASLAQSQQQQQYQSPPRPNLVPSNLPFTRIRVSASTIKLNERNKEVVSFEIQVQLVLPPSTSTTDDQQQQQPSTSSSASTSTGGSGYHTWRVDKLYSDILTLDATVKGKASRSERSGIGSLPDKSLFKDHAPHKSDQRKAVIGRYLQTLIGLPLRDRTAVCTFFNTDVAPESNGQMGTTPVMNGSMEGWLTKRGRNFGGWQTRYYVLTPGSCLSYYDAPHGTKIGEIPLLGAAIGRQSSRAAADGTIGEDAYLHAFLIRTQNDREKEEDHILCAENDEMRDRWVNALTTLQLRAGSGGGTGQTTSNRERTTSNSVSSPLANNVSSLPSHPTVVPPTDSDMSTFVNRDRRRSGSGPVPSTTMQPEQDSRGLSARFGSDLPPSVSLPANLDSVARSEGPLESTSNGLSALSPVKKSNLSDQGHTSFATVSSSGSTPSSSTKLQPPSSRRPGNSNDRPVSPDGRRNEVYPHGSVGSSAGGGMGTIASTKYSASDVSGPMNAVPLPSGYEFKKAERQKKTKSSFWNFAGRGSGDKNSPSHAPAPSRPVFGVPLKEAVAISRIRPGLELPAVVYRCVEFLEAKNAEHEEGIFRLSGSANVIRVLKDRFNAEGDVNLLQSTEYYDPHAIAGLLKQYLRELPVHLLTRELQPEFLRVIELRNRKDRVNALGKLVARLPIEEYTLFRFFFAHLCVIAQNAETSKMNLRNLGIVFSPTLAIPAPLFSLLLAEFDLVFAVEKETGTAKPIMVDDEPSTEDLAPTSSERRQANRNSQLYQASGADKLMETELTKLRETEEVEDDATADAIEDDSDPTGGVYSDAASNDPSSPTYDPSSTQTYQYTSGMTSSPSFAAFNNVSSSSSNGANSNNTLAAQPRSPGLPSSPRPGAIFDTSSPSASSSHASNVPLAPPAR